MVSTVFLQASSAPLLREDKGACGKGVQVLGKVQAEHSWMWSHQLWEVISARPGAKQCMLCAGRGGMGTFVPQVPKDVLEKMAEHKKGEESSPGSPAVGQPPHGGDNKRY